MFETVVLINDHCSPNGGAAAVAIASARILRERGFKTRFFCGTGVPPQDLEQLTRSLGGEEIAHDPQRLRAIFFGIWNPQSRRTLRGFLGGFPTASTLVHFHGWVKSLSSSVIDVVDRMGFASVYTLHDYFTACPNGGFYNYRVGQVCTLSPMSVSCLFTDCDSRSFAHKIWRVCRQTCQNSVLQPSKVGRNYILLSEKSASVLRPYFSKDSRFYFVRNPILPLTSDRVSAHRNHAFMFVGRLSPEKGADLFCAAARAAGVSAVVIGDGPQKEYLMRRFPEHRFTGWLNREEVASEASSARALVFPSRWYEVQPLAPLEAMASGLPVIASDVCAAASFIRDGDNGMLFSSENEEALCVALKRSSESDAKWRNMSDRVFQDYWAAPWGTLQHGDDLENCYRAVWSSRERGAARR